MNATPLTAGRPTHAAGDLAENHLLLLEAIFHRARLDLGHRDPEIVTDAQSWLMFQDCDLQRPRRWMEVRPCRKN